MHPGAPAEPLGGSPWPSGARLRPPQRWRASTFNPQAERIGECFMEFTHDAGCPQGWAPGAFDFYELLPSFILRHADGACADAAFARGLGTFATPEQCAKACHATSGCARFAFHHTAEELGAGGDELPAGACTVAEAAVDGWYYPPADGRFDSAECKAHSAWREGWSEHASSGGTCPPPCLTTARPVGLRGPSEGSGCFEDEPTTLPPTASRWRTS